MTTTQVHPDWRVQALGLATVRSPLGLSTVSDDGVPDYVPEGTRVLYDTELSPGELPDSSRSFEKAGPRERIFFEPTTTRAGILTAGGLCPGLNNVIRSLVLHLVHRYGIAEVVGFRYGYAGLDPASSHPPIVLRPGDVQHIHTRGGTLLGTSRGAHPANIMVDTLVAHRINCVFAIGGDGTMRGAHAIAEEIARRGLSIAVVGIPKSIDNDIPFVDKTFGFDTAITMARIAIEAAHNEALAVRNGIGLVKLMGRNAGFIAAHATLASHEVNVCLVPEAPFGLDGPHGLLAYLTTRLEKRSHAVIVVAEGCGVHLASSTTQPRDASGNLDLQTTELDIGAHLKSRITEHFKHAGIPVTLKYIDPSYMLRGVPATAVDSVFCDELARYAAHAAMAGKTAMMIGRWHRSFTHVPLGLVTTQRRRIDPDKELWLAVTETTGQPRFV